MEKGRELVIFPEFYVTIEEGKSYNNNWLLN